MGVSGEYFSTARASAKYVGNKSTARLARGALRRDVVKSAVEDEEETDVDKDVEDKEEGKGDDEDAQPPRTGDVFPKYGLEDDN